MNIFAIDRDPKTAARWLVDKHVVKMPVEYAQMLCTCHWVEHGVNNRAQAESVDASVIFPSFPLGISPYLPTHVNHPSSKWARHNLANYEWLCEHALETCKEYTRRYGKKHSSEAVIQWCYDNPPRNLDATGEMTDFSPAMPDEFKVIGDGVKSYREYYSKGKKHIHTWKDFTSKPDWI